MNLLEAIMCRDECSKKDAQDLIDEMKILVHEEGCDPEEVLYDEGFEPDYIFDLLD